MSIVLMKKALKVAGDLRPADNWIETGFKNLSLFMRFIKF